MRSLHPARLREPETKHAAPPWPVPAVGASDEELAVDAGVQHFVAVWGRSASRAERRSIAWILQQLEGISALVTRAAEHAARVGLTAVLELLEEPFESSTWMPPEYAASVIARLESLPAHARVAAGAATLFPGGFDARALVHVLATAEKSEAIYAIEALLEAGLLAPCGDGRFVMRRPEREIVRRVLGADAAQASRFVAAVVTDALRGPPVDASPRALAMRPNVEVALSLAAAAHDAAATVSLTGWLGRMYLAAGPVRTFVLLGERLVHLFESGALQGDALHAEALWLRGLAKTASGAYAEAAADFTRACESAAPTIRALSLSKRALLRGLAGDFEGAQTLAADAAALGEGAPPYVRGELAKDEANLYSETGSERVYESMLRARAIFRKSGHAREEAFVVMMLASRACDRGEVGETRRLCKQSLELFGRVGDRRSQAWVLCLSGLAEQEAGKMQRAANRFRRARKTARGFGDETTAALATGFQAGLALERGLLDEALEAYATVLEALAGPPHAGWRAYFEAGVASAQAELGRLTLAAETSARALAVQGRPARHVASEMLAASIEVARAQRVETLDAQREIVRRLATQLPTEETRFARRVVERQILARRASLAPVRLTIGPEAEWFERDGVRVELRRRRMLHRLFARLALAPAGTRVSTVELVRYVWSDEHVSPAAAANRLYVAVARLRTEGLTDVLAQDPDGYFLAGEVVRSV